MVLYHMKVKRIHLEFSVHKGNVRLKYLFFFNSFSKFSRVSPLLQGKMDNFLHFTLHFNSTWLPKASNIGSHIKLKCLHFFALVKYISRLIPISVCIGRSYYVITRVRAYGSGSLHFDVKSVNNDGKLCVYFV